MLNRRQFCNHGIIKKYLEFLFIANQENSSVEEKARKTEKGVPQSCILD